MIDRKYRLPVAGLQQVVAVISVLLLLKETQANQESLLVSIRRPSSVPLGASAHINCDISTTSGQPVTHGPFGTEAIVHDLVWVHDTRHNLTTIFMYSNDNALLAPNLHGRVTAGWSSAGHWLDIREATISDYGMYTCMVNDQYNAKKVLTVYDGPENMTLDVPVHVKENEEVSISCNLDAVFPPANILWCIGDRSCRKAATTINRLTNSLFSVSATGRLNLTRTKDNSPVPVSCRAVNPNNPSDIWRTEQVLVNVYYAPETEVVPADSSIRAIAGKPYNLECRTISANPPAIARYQWRNQASWLNTSQRSLTIEQLLPSIDYQYKCKAKNSVGYGKYSIGYDLQVFYAPVIQPADPLEPLTEGATVELPCVVLRANPSDITAVTWTKDGGPILQPYLYGTADHPSVKFTHVSYLNHVGVYVCAVANEIGETRSRPVRLDVFHEPHGAATINRRTVNVVAGQRVSLQCQPPVISGFPVATHVTWLKQEEDAMVAISNQTQDVFSFQTYGVTDSGQFACMVSNEFGLSELSELTAVHVNAPAYVEYPRSSDVTGVIASDDNDGFLLECLASGNNGHVQIIWWLDGQEVDLSRFHTEVTTETTTMPHHYGELIGRRSRLIWNPTSRGCSELSSYAGAYVCRAEATVVGQLTHDLSATIHVSVEYAAQWIGTSNEVHAAPGDTDVVLSCPVCANPAPLYHWRSPTPFAHGSSELHIDKVDSTHFGNYTCIVTNTVKGVEITREFPVYLVEKGPPHAPTRVRVVDELSTSRSLLVRWKPGSDGGYPPQHFHIDFQSPDNHWKVSSVGMNSGMNNWMESLLMGLQPNTSYTIRLRAENQRPATDGAHNSSEYIFTEGRTKNKPDVHLQSVVIKSEMIIVTWTFDAGDKRLRRSATTESAVGIVVHYQSGSGQPRTYPTNAPHQNIPIEHREATVRGNFSAHTLYKVWISVYEGMLLTPSLSSPIGVHRMAAPGANNHDLLIGGLVSCLTLVILIFVGFFFFLKCRKQGTLKSSEVEMNSQRVPVGYMPVESNQNKHSSPPVGLSPQPDVCNSLDKSPKQHNNINESQNAETIEPLLVSEKDELLHMSSPYENMDLWPQLTNNTTHISPATDEAIKEAQAGGDIELVYADLSFEQPRASKPDIVHGKQETVDYATIDFQAMAAKKV